MLRRLQFDIALFFVRLIVTIVIVELIAGFLVGLGLIARLI